MSETRTTEYGAVSELASLRQGVTFTPYHQELVGLLARICLGDEDALAALYDKTRSHVYGLAIRVLNDVTMAEEVTMDVYLQVWKDAGRFDQARGNPLVWLSIITRSRAIDRMRVGRKDREGREPLDTLVESEGMDADPEQSSFYLEQCRIVREALSNLPPEQREVIELAYFGGLSQSEMAAKIGQPIGTVKTRVRLGMIRLRNILGPFAEGLAS